MAGRPPFDFRMLVGEMVAPVADVVPAGRFVALMIEPRRRGGEQREIVVFVIGAQETGGHAAIVVFHDIGRPKADRAGKEPDQPVHVGRADAEMLQPAGQAVGSVGLGPHRHPENKALAVGIEDRHLTVGEHGRALIAPPDALCRHIGIEAGKPVRIRQGITDIAEALFRRRPEDDIALASRQPDRSVGQFFRGHFQVRFVPWHDRVDLRRLKAEMMKMGGPEGRLGHAVLLSVG